MRVRTIAGWLVLGTAVAVVLKLTEPDEHGRTEDAEEADTERGYEHAPGDHDSEWDRHVDDAVSLGLPLLPVREKEWHSVTCPCALCVQYTTHEIENNWPAPFLRVVPPQRGDDSA